MATLSLFQEELDKCWKIFSSKYPGYAKPQLVVRCSNEIWGSMNCGVKPPVMTLNTRLENVDVEHLREVIFHEFCHLKNHNHSRAFWDMYDSLVTHDTEDTQKRLEKLKELTDNILLFS